MEEFNFHLYDFCIVYIFFTVNMCDVCHLGEKKKFLF